MRTVDAWQAPLSTYATAGARAFGFLGRIPDDSEEYPGAALAEYAKLPNNRTLEPKTFVFAEFTYRPTVLKDAADTVEVDSSTRDTMLPF